MFRYLMLSAVAAATLSVAAIGTSGAASAHDWDRGGARVPDSYDLSRPHRGWRDRVIYERGFDERPAYGAYGYSYGWRRHPHYDRRQAFYGDRYYRGW